MFEGLSDSMRVQARLGASEAQQAVKQVVQDFVSASLDVGVGTRVDSRA